MLIRRNNLLRIIAAIILLCCVAGQGAWANVILTTISPAIPSFLPAGLPTNFTLGLLSQGVGTGDLAWMTASGVPWNYRYNYLSGPGTSPVTPGTYVSDSIRNKYIQVITFYTSPNLSTLNDPATMNAYYANYVATLTSAKNWNLWYAQRFGYTYNTISTDLTTVTHTSPTTHDDITISGNFHNTGKWVTRLHFNTLATSPQVGLAYPNAPFADYLGANPGSFGIGSNGLFIDNTIVNAQPALSFVSGDNVDIAVDMDAQLLWARKNTGNWNNDGTASPGVSGGIFFGAGGGNGTHGLAAGQTVSPSVNIADFNDQATFGTPPTITGFNAWNSAPANPPIIVHLEPDLWGYMQSGGVTGRQTDDPTQVPISVASSGFAGLGTLPNTAVGFAEALKLLRDTDAPRIYLAWHASTWGPQDGYIPTAPSFGEPIATTAQRVANFYNALHTPFDLIFHDTTSGDRDSDYALLVAANWNTAVDPAWWTPASLENYRQFLLNFHKDLTQRTAGMLWQIAIGNDLYLSCNDTSRHYQDNKVEFFLTEGIGIAQGVFYSASDISNFISAGIVGILFGKGQNLDTTNYDTGDGITNPPPWRGGGGQTTFKTATVSDDDGGFLRAAAAVYYTNPIPLK